MANARLYPFWGSLTEALRTGQPQSEAKTGGDFFAAVYADPKRLAQFAAAMSGLSASAGEAIAAHFPWRDYGSVVDIGCAEGAVSAAIALAHEHVTGGGFDLPPLEPLFNAYVASTGCWPSSTSPNPMTAKTQGNTTIRRQPLPNLQSAPKMTAWPTLAR